MQFNAKHAVFHTLKSMFFNLHPLYSCPFRPLVFHREELRANGTRISDSEKENVLDTSVSVFGQWKLIKQYVPRRVGCIYGPQWTFPVQANFGIFVVKRRIFLKICYKVIYWHFNNNVYRVHPIVHRPTRRDDHFFRLSARINSIRLKKTL